MKQWEVAAGDNTSTGCLREKVKEGRGELAGGLVAGRKSPEIEKSERSCQCFQFSNPVFNSEPSQFKQRILLGHQLRTERILSNL